MAQLKVAKDSNRGLTWTHVETLALFQVRSDTGIQEDFEKCRRNTSVYEKIVKRLRECGLKPGRSIFFICIFLTEKDANEKYRSTI